MTPSGVDSGCKISKFNVDQFTYLCFNYTHTDLHDRSPLLYDDANQCHIGGEYKFYTSMILIMWLN